MCVLTFWTPLSTELDHPRLNMFEASQYCILSQAFTGGEITSSQFPANLGEHPR